MSTSLHVVLASDHRYFIGLLVSAASLAWWLPATNQLHLHILDDGIQDSQFRTLKKRIQKLKPASSIYRYDVKKLDLQRYSGSHDYPATAIARLLIPSLISINEYILYLDVDTICLADLSNLATLSMGKHVMAACTEVVGQSCLADDCPFDLNSEADRRAAYFNTGVLLINPAAWRDQQITEQALAELARSDIKFRYADQTVLNYIARHRILELDGGYNTLHSLFDSTQQNWPQVLHYYGGTKPWHCFQPQSDSWLAWYITSKRIASVKLYQQSSLLWRPLLKAKFQPSNQSKRDVVNRLAAAVAVR